MKIVGYLKNKTKVRFLVDNIDNPKIFSTDLPFMIQRDSSPDISWNKFQSDHAPVIKLKFKINDYGFSSINSGVVITLIDQDTLYNYALINDHIFNLTQDIISGVVENNNGIFEALFNLTKNGTRVSLEYITNIEKINFI